jgi:hypothetical protein
LVRAGASGAATADGEPWRALSASHDAMAACADRPVRSVSPRQAPPARRRRGPPMGYGAEAGALVRALGSSEPADGRGVLEYSRRAGPAGGRRRNERRTRACVRVCHSARGKEGWTGCGHGRAYLQLSDLRLLGLQLGAQPVDLRQPGAGRTRTGGKRERA